MMLQPAVLDIAQQLMLVTQDHQGNFNVAGPMIVAQITSPAVMSIEGIGVRESTQLLWRSMLQMRPPIELVASLYQYATHLLGLGGAEYMTPREFPQIINLCTDYMAIGRREFVMANGEAYIAALSTVMQNTTDADIYQ